MSSNPRLYLPALDPETFVGMLDRVVAKHPNVRGVAPTLREVHSTNHRSWSAVAWLDGKTHTAPPCASWTCSTAWAAAHGFAAGLIYGLLTGEAPEQAVRLGGRTGRC